MVNVHGYPNPYLFPRDNTQTSLTSTLGTAPGDATITSGHGDTKFTNLPMLVQLTDLLGTTSEMAVVTAQVGDTLTFGERGLGQTSATTWVAGTLVKGIVGAEGILRMLAALQDHDNQRADVKAFGAVGDLQGPRTDGSMTSGSATLVVTTGTDPVWTDADVGKLIEVSGAGGTNLPLCSTITAVDIDGRSCTLAQSASASTSGATLYWGTNDSPAIRLAIASLADGGELFFPPGKYYVDADGGPTSTVFAVTQAITIRGTGRKTSIIRQHNPGYHLFRLYASTQVEAMGFHSIPWASTIGGTSPLGLNNVRVFILDFSDTPEVPDTTVVLRDCDFLNVLGALHTASTAASKAIRSVLVDDCYIVLNPKRVDHALSVNPLVFFSGVSSVILRDSTFDASIDTRAIGSFNNIYAYGLNYLQIVGCHVIDGIGIKLHPWALPDPTLYRWEIARNTFYRCSQSIEVSAADSVQCSLALLDISDNLFFDSRTTFTGYDVRLAGGHFVLNTCMLRNNLWASPKQVAFGVQLDNTAYLNHLVTVGNVYDGWAIDNTSPETAFRVDGTGTYGQWTSVGDQANGLSDPNAHSFHLYNETNGFAQTEVIGLTEKGVTTGTGGTANATALHILPSGGSPVALQAESAGGGPSLSGGVYKVSRWARWTNGVNKGAIPIFALP